MCYVEGLQIRLPDTSVTHYPEHMYMYRTIWVLVHRVTHSVGLVWVFAN